MTPLQLSQETRVIAGAVLLTIVTIEFGGWFLSRIVRGQVSFTPSSRPSPAPGTRTRGCW